jgi:hypothetical protein
MTPVIQNVFTIQQAWPGMTNEEAVRGRCWTSRWCSQGPSIMGSLRAVQQHGLQTWSTVCRPPAPCCKQFASCARPVQAVPA